LIASWQDILKEDGCNALLCYVVLKFFDFLIFLEDLSPFIFIEAGILETQIRVAGILET